MNPVLGVDPSFNRTGWAVLRTSGEGSLLEATGIIAPRPGERGERLLTIWKEFGLILDRCQPVAVYLERPGTWQRAGGTRRETIEMLSMSRALMIVACADRCVPVHEVEVHVVRRAVFGRVNASGGDVLDFVRSQGYEIPRRPRGGPDADIANAIVMALYGISLSNGEFQH